MATRQLLFGTPFGNLPCDNSPVICRFGPRPHSVSVLLALLLTGASALAAQQSPEAPPPEEPNPWLSLLPVGAEPHWQWWRETMAQEARRRRALRAPRQRPPIVYGESEPFGVRGLNDHALVGEPVNGFGSAPGLESSLTLSGSLRGAPVAQGGSPEPNGSIPLSLPLSLSFGVQSSIVSQIGDGLYGSGGTGSGDFDVFAVDARALQTLRVYVRSLEPDVFDPALLLLDSTGRILATADDVLDGFNVKVDAQLTYELLLDGRYFLVVGGQDDDPPLNLVNPFDPASGRGARSEGAYDLVTVLDLDSMPDVDYYSLELRAGDVVGANLLSGDVRLSLERSNGDLLVSSRIDLSGIYPASSPLPGGGRVALAYVIDQDGRYALGVESPPPFGDASYNVEVTVDRSPGQPPGVRQKLFLDFDGAELLRVEFPPIHDDRVMLSPLSAFLPGWELSSQDEDELIDGIVAVVRENLSEDVRLFGSNGDFASAGVPGRFDIEVENSRDHPDPGGDPNTMRVVIGGTIEELGLSTVGIAGAIDPGNFETRAIAVVLLDLLSAPLGNPNSLAGVARNEGTSLLDLVAVAVGNIAAHEAGHLFGDFHTRRDVGLPTIMDRGGSLTNVLGVGDDGTWGTADDLDVDLGPDGYEPSEGFSGSENTLEVVSFGLPAGGSAPRLSFSVPEVDFGPRAIGSTVPAQVSVTNSGTAPLELQAVTIESDSGGVFSLTSVGTLPRAVDPGQDTTIDLDFTPNGPELFEGWLTIDSDDPEAPRSALRLRGSGGLPLSGIDPTVVDFGSVVYDRLAVSVNRQVRVENNGTGPLQIEAVLAGAHPERFLLSNAAPTVLAAGERLDLSLDFRPNGAIGDSRGSLLVRTSDPGQPVLLAELLGRSDGADIEVSPDAWFFGFVTLGKQISRVFRVTNKGTRPLSVAATELADDGLGEIALTASDFPGVVAPAETRQFTLTFRPSERTVRQGLVVVRSDDPDEPEIEVSLVGSGNRPEAVLDSERIDFGLGPADFSAVQELQITNVDSFFDLRVTLTIEGSDRFAVDGPTSIRVPAYESRSVVVSFMAAGQLPAAGELVLSTNDPLEPETRVPLTGQIGVAVPALGIPGLVLLSGLLLLLGWRSVGRRRQE